MARVFLIALLLVPHSGTSGPAPSDTQVPASFLAVSAVGIRALQTWYIRDTGLWRTTNWWNAANAVTVLARYSKLSGTYPAPPERDWGREEVHKNWVVAVKAGKPAPCHCGYAGPFTEAYQLGNVALRVGHRFEWDPLAFRVTNYREDNQYPTREYRHGWDLREIAGRAAFQEINV